MFASLGHSWPLVCGAVLVALLLAPKFFRWLKSFRTPEPYDARATMASTFLIEPFIQLGDAPALAAAETVEVFWFTKENRRNWTVQVRPAGEKKWRKAIAVERTVNHISHLGKHLHFRALLKDLNPGIEFEYRILADDGVAFGATGKTRASFDQPYTVVVAGDLGEPEAGNTQRVAHRIDLSHPDFVAMPGDIVYTRGRVSEYLRNLFPVYNTGKPSPKTGGSVLRTRIAMPAAGNHDVALPNVENKRDFTKWPDLMAYFLFWSLPLNGPYTKAGIPNTPVLEGDEKERYKFAVAAGDRYPQMANYSFDWGNSHWTVLDSNAYVDWTDAELRAWVAADLAKAQKATWRFVMFHHPVFSSDGKHVNEQRMRLLANLFQRCNVDMVFTGHVHCYERTVPVRFKEDALQTCLNTEECPVTGTFELDTDYDGITKTKPNGVIYVVAGASGAKFYPEQAPKEGQLKPYTKVYDQSAHSFMHIEVNGKRLVARQVTDDGREIDRFIIDK